jgi:hypothetical protein
VVGEDQTGGLQRELQAYVSPLRNVCKID